MSNRRDISCAIALLLMLPHSVLATTRHVPTDYPTIQHAISLSADGDTVLVLQGVYQEHLTLVSRGIVVRSQSGPAVTTIDATGQSSSVVYFSDCDELTHLDGFTLRGGTGTIGGGQYNDGGGIFIPDSRGQGPTIENNVITYNTGRLGGGLYLKDSARVIHNQISFNSAIYEGGGLKGEMPLDAKVPLIITDNEVFSNRVVADGDTRVGGGLYAAGYTYIARNIVACNEADHVAGVFWATGDRGLTMERNTILGNWGRHGVGGVYFNMWQTGLPIGVVANVVVFNFGGGVKCTLAGGWRIDALCNDIHGNNPDFVDDNCRDTFMGNGNVSVDPLFGQSSGCPPAEGDLCLSPESPLLPEHSPPGCGLIGARGRCLPSAVGDVSPDLIGTLRALPARPNPFFERTAIAFYLPEPGEAEISIYGVLGRKVRTLTVGALPAGENELEWDGRGDDGDPAASGAYVAVIQAGDREVTRVLLLIR